jgi:hypothetical protein
MSKLINKTKVKVSTKTNKTIVARSDSSKNRQKAEIVEKPLTTAQKLDAIGIDAICAYVESGESLRSWSIKNNLPNRSVNDWIEADVDRAAHYAKAREERADAVFDSLDNVSDEAVRAENSVQVAGLRLKADNIKWKLARMNAKKYGEKIAVGGAEGLPPVQITEIITRIVGA